MNSDRIREIQEQTAYPESRSVAQALVQVWHEVGAELESVRIERDALRSELSAVLADWNQLCQALGSPTNRGAIGHANRLRALLAQAENKGADLAEPRVPAAYGRGAAGTI